MDDKTKIENSFYLDKAIEYIDHQVILLNKLNKDNPIYTFEYLCTFYLIEFSGLLQNMISNQESVDFLQQPLPSLFE